MQDPLSITVSLGGVDPTLPLLAEQDYTFQIKTSVIKPNKDANGHNWEIVLALTENATAIDGRQIKAGYSVYNTNALQPKEDSTDPEGFKRGIAATIDAIFNTNKDNRPDFDMNLVNSVVGKLVTAQLYIDEYPAGSGKKSNKIRRLKPVVSA
jgi:hypothetical protein